MDRVDANRDVYESWPLEIKDAVLSGQVLKGMTTDMVYVARGKPAERVDRGNGDEIWVYHVGTTGSSGGALGGGGIIPRGTTVTVGTGGSGYPGSAYPYPTYPGTYPGSSYPYPSGYPSGGSGIYVPPIVLGGGGNSSTENVIEEQIVFRNGRVTHGDGVK